MARTSAKSSVKEVSENKIEESILDAVENEEKEVIKPKIKNIEPLDDSDEIEVVSLIPNVSYKDSMTGDMYEWDDTGHIEYMTFDILKNMWRNHKGYFRNMWLKPNDDRVIDKFGLTKTFEKYEFLMDESNYTRNNIKEICDIISTTPNGLKMSICNKIKDFIVNGQVTDVKVVRALEKYFDLDLIDLL